MLRAGRGVPVRRVLSLLWALVVTFGLVALLVGLLAMAPAATAEPSGVALNEVNCAGTDWAEVINRSNARVSIAGWLLTDDALDRVPLRDSHRMRFGADAVLGPGARLVVTQGVRGFPFGLSCGDDTLRLADATDTLVDAVTLPVLATTGMTCGRYPDGTGKWKWMQPTAGTANSVAADTKPDDPAWLYDPLKVNEIDLEASPDALAQLAAVPSKYVEARITMHNGATTYGPYGVGLKLKGHTGFRTLEGKAAFKVKFGHSVAGQSFHGLKVLTLNNMVQDASMIAEATTSLLLQATGAPTVRVGYAHVRLNGAEYGLYANVETVDAVMAKRSFTGTQHIYEANLGGEDASPGHKGEFDVQEGSSTDRSDLEALSVANAGGADGWWERMKPVADLAEMTRAWAAEHYAGHHDGYSIGTGAIHPANYYLHSDLAGRFALIVSGTDQTWLERPAFGVYGNGVLMRGCVADLTCRHLYIDALRQIAASPVVAALPAKARAIRAVIAPWRVRDPRREDTVAVGEAHADIVIATLDARPAKLAAWLASPHFVDAVESQKPLTPPLVVRPLLGKPVGAPAKPVAGQRFIFSLRVTRSDTGTLLRSGRMDCAPSVAGKVIRHTESFKAGTARLSFVVPDAAKGKPLRVKIAITASGQTAGRTYTYAVR
jgi:hypothetical protein